MPSKAVFLICAVKSAPEAQVIAVCASRKAAQTWLKRKAGIVGAEVGVLYDGKTKQALQDDIHSGRDGLFIKSVCLNAWYIHSVGGWGLRHADEWLIEENAHEIECDDEDYDAILEDYDSILVEREED